MWGRGIHLCSTLLDRNLVVEIIEGGSTTARLQMPLKTQRPARRRQPHSEAQVTHIHSQKRIHPWLNEVKPRSREHAELRRIERRKERARVRAAKHAGIMAPPGLSEYLVQRRVRQVEAERARAQVAHEREFKKQRRVRRRSPEYHAIWTKRLERYVRRRVSREKRVSKRVLNAANRVGISIVA